MINTFGVPGENEIRRRVIDFLCRNRLWVGYKSLKHKYIHKYTMIARSRAGIELKVMIKRNMIKCVNDVKT